MGCTSSKTEPVIVGKSGRYDTNNSKDFQKAKLRSQQHPAETNAAPKVDEKGHLLPEEVQKRIVGCSQVKTTTVGGTGENDPQTEIQYAYLTQRGYYPTNIGQPNQDAYSITLKLGGEANDLLLAVYDGHGTNGHDCAQFARKDIPRSVAKYVRQKRSSRHIAKLKAEGKSTKGAFRPELWSTLNEEDYGECCRKAFVETNKALHENEKINDKLSGTTVVTVNFHRGQMTVCNLGDSRAVLGSISREGDQDNKIQAIPLSTDQTPYRKDERERVQAAGAEIKSIDQLQGRSSSMEVDWGDVKDGEVENPHTDPPRIWVKGNEFPGTAFTRSIGDTVAENIGVIAEPEMMSRQLTADDKYLVIASDGLFEFLKNQQVMEIVHKSSNSDPVEACERLRKAAYEQWLEHENRVDDITIIVCFLSTPAPSSSGTN